MSGTAAPRGRGAGVNKPAWLVQQEREAALGSAPKSDELTSGNNGDLVVNEKSESTANNAAAADTEERDQFGRSVGRSNGSSSRDYQDDRHHRSSRSSNDYRSSRDRDHRYSSSSRSNDHYNDRHSHRGSRRDRNHHRSSGRSDHHRSSRNTNNNSGIYFHSYEEERAWLEERRRKRQSRKSLFDVEPSPEQLKEEEARAALERDHLMMTGGMGMGMGATSASAASSMGGGMRSDGRGGGGGSLQSQQTRHARRLYIGNIPDIRENDVHNFFREAIRSSIILDEANPNPNHQKQYVDNDPIISVYINRERRFAFLEFKTMEITTACLDLDGINVMGQGKVNIKRPNDYNPAWAPPLNQSTAPKLDTAKLGIISSTVMDGPNKIFIGGLPYHLTESQVLELLGAFGTVKAFHLVKADANAVTSKGYCFVEYADPNLTQVACMGLNGMDMGGGKQLSCRMAVQGQAAATDNSGMAAIQAGGGAFSAPVAAPPASATVVDGVDVDALLNAALGGAGGGAVAAVPAATAPVMQMNPMPMAQPQQATAVDPMAVANMLDAALGGAAANGPVGGVPPQPVLATTPQATRVLVLLNMVLDEDLANDEDYGMLEEEVREEVGKYGKLLSMKIPRPQDGCAPSAVKKIFLEYATTNDAMNAEKELKGRAFGPNVVDATYFSEENYARNALS